MEIKLSNNKGYCWQSLSSLSFKGIIWDSEDRKELTINELHLLFKEVVDLDDIKRRLETLDGHFSFILETKNKIYLVADRLRTMPLFYSIEHNCLVSDSTDLFKEYYDARYNSVNREQFLSTGYVLGSDTMLDKVYQVQAGEIVCIEKNSLKVERLDYFLYRYGEAFTLNGLELLEELESVYDSVFKSLVEKLNGLPVILPLSGGYDSRLIIHMLFKHGYKNVTCFTYGDKNNWEVSISKSVANYYGYEWHFLEYLPTELFELYKNEVEKYFKFSVMDSSFGHTQDLLAVKKMKELGLISDSSIFIPGHSGDFVAGSHIPNNYEKIDPTDYLFNKHCTLLPVTFIKDIKTKIELQINSIANDQTLDSAQAIEFWDWRERQSKYICNSVKVYEFFGYKWVLPLWDKEIMDFWLKVPLEYKLNRKIYYQFANNLHGEIKSNPKINIFTKIKDKVFDTWYSRFFKHPYTYHFKTLDDAFPNAEIPAHIDRKYSLVKVNKAGLNTLKMWNSTKGSL